MTAVPYALTRCGTVMTPDPADPNEAMGVLNPAGGTDPDGTLCLLPRLVAAGNVSRVGLAAVVLKNGVPVGVERRGVVLEPTERWERGAQNAGVEDPRVTWIPELRRHVMTYVAFGPLGPRLALAVSTDLRAWARLGPVLFGYQPELGVDLNLYPNKDAVFFPGAVPGPRGPSIAMLHRPMWDLSWVRPGETDIPPRGVTDVRPGIWISYLPLAEAIADPGALVRMRDTALVAMPEHAWEALKIGAGPPPLRVPQGWLLLHHGVSGTMSTDWGPQQDVHYAAGAMLLDPDQPGRVLARTPEPLLAPETDEERTGLVPNVVFPTATGRTDAGTFVFYGMADARIGVARLDAT